MLEINGEEKAISLVRTYGDMRFVEGMKRGLRSLNTVRNWLTRQPDRKWQQEVRSWVDKHIEEYKKEIERYEPQIEEAE